MRAQLLDPMEIDGTNYCNIVLKKSLVQYCSLNGNRKRSVNGLLFVKNIKTHLLKLQENKQHFHTISLAT